MSACWVLIQNVVCLSRCGWVNCSDPPGNNQPPRITPSCVHNSTHYPLVSQTCSPVQQLVVWVLVFFCLSLIYTSDFNETIVTCGHRIYDKHIWLKTAISNISVLCVSSCFKMLILIAVFDFLGHLKSCRWPV